MSHQIALITGANSGIGLATAKGLAAQGFDLLLLVRSAQKGEATRNEILKQYPSATIDIEIADLEDIKSVIQATQRIKSRYQAIDRIINNAGYSPARIEYTSQGYEKSFVANHLGHFALTTNLLDLLEASGDGRVINVASSAYVFGNADRMFTQNNANLTTMKAYGDGKLANIFFTKGLSKKMVGKSVAAFALHPGVVNSGFGANFTGLSKLFMKLTKPFMITPEKGAQTTLFLATAAASELKNHSGAYFQKAKVQATKHKDITEEKIEEFWQKSLEAMRHFA